MGSPVLGVPWKPVCLLTYINLANKYMPSFPTLLYANLRSNNSQVSPLFFPLYKGVGTEWRVMWTCGVFYFVYQHLLVEVVMVSNLVSYK